MGRFIRASVLAVVAAVCAMLVFTRGARATSEQEFWRWFVRNSDALFHIEQNQALLFDHLADRLSRVHPDLTFQFGPVEDGKREFVISADGIREAFPHVVRLVRAAPELDQWEIVAFRQRTGTEHWLEYEGYRLDPQEIFFRARPDGSGKVELALYLPHYGEDDRRIVTALFLLLDCALGEYDVETKIGAIEIHPLPEQDRDPELRPFKELPSVVDAYFAAQR